MDGKKSNPLKKKIVILGAGSWGSALAIHLQRLHHQVILWARDETLVQNILRHHENKRYLPGIIFPRENPIQLCTSLEQALKDAEYVLINVPSHAFAQIIHDIAPYLLDNQKLIWATKGLDPSSNCFLSELVQKSFVSRPYGLLSGPSFALEVAKGLPTAITLASNDLSFADECATLFHSPTFRVYTSNDMIGVQLGGIIKNVLAIAVGISDGLGFGANARCALITRGLHEMNALAKVMGAKTETLVGLSCLGDLILTCTDNQSRNRRFGLALGEGQSIPEAVAKIGQVVEGLHNAEQIINMALKFQVELPICLQVQRMVSGQIAPKEALYELLTRTPKRESTSF